MWYECRDAYLIYKHTINVIYLIYTTEQKFVGLERNKWILLFSKDAYKIIIRNVSWAANQHIRMISEGSCDTEDWSNDAENSVLLHKNKLHFKIYSNRKQLFQIVIIFHNITELTVFFVQINAVLVSRTLKKILLTQSFEWSYTFYVFYQICIILPEYLNVSLITQFLPLRWTLMLLLVTKNQRDTCSILKNQQYVPTNKSPFHHTTAQYYNSHTSCS